MSSESGTKSACPNLVKRLKKWAPGPVKVPKEYEDFDYTYNEATDGYCDPPYFLNPFILPNAGIPLSYFNTGIAIYLLSTPVSYYLISNLGASSTQYSAYSTLLSLPWSFKFAFGMISDGIPILRYRRKSWMYIGWCMFIIINLILASIGTPDIGATTGLMFLMTCSYLLADVCCDTCCVERARYEIASIKGSLQTSGYTIRAYGMIVGATLGAILYNTPTWGWGLTIAQLFALSALIPATAIFVTLWNFDELASTKSAPNLFEQIHNIWCTLQLRAVWLPISFIYIYYIFQVPNSAWSNFLVVGLGFTDFELGTLTIASAVMSYLGLVIYKQYFFETSWRDIYIYTTIIGAFFSFLQVKHRSLKSISISSTTTFQ